MGRLLLVIRAEHPFSSRVAARAPPIRCASARSRRSAGKPRVFPTDPFTVPDSRAASAMAQAGLTIPEFSLAGTLYRSPSSRLPFRERDHPLHRLDRRAAQDAEQLRGQLLSSAGTTGAQVGRFGRSSNTRMSTDTTKMTEMTAAIFRETSCSTCHADPASPSTVGHLYVAEDATTLPETPCQ